MPLLPRVLHLSNPDSGTDTQASQPVAEVSAATEPARSPSGYANLDPDDDRVTGPPDVRPTCEDELRAADIRFRPATLPRPPRGNKLSCGAPQVVVYRGSREKISYEPTVTTTCTMALALARFEHILQEEAMATFGKRVVRIHQIGTYVCRPMTTDDSWPSEHSYANAIDLTTFVLEDGRKIDVIAHFKPLVAAPTKKETLFLRKVGERAFDEQTFSAVLTPYYDRHHNSHFHLDLGRFRYDGSRPLVGPGT